MSDKAGEMSKDGACFLVHLKTPSQTKLHAAVLVKLIVSQLVKKFAVFYRTRMFTRSYHWMLSCAA